MTTAEPTHIHTLVSNNPEIWLWVPVCKCLTADWCPLHGYKTNYFPTLAPTNLERLEIAVSEAEKLRKLFELKIAEIHKRVFDR